MNAKISSITKMTSPVIPTLLCRKCRMICSRWLRARMVNSRSGPSGVGAPGSAGRTDEVLAAELASVVAIACPFSAGVSGQPDPRVEHRVEDVGDQVEQDHEEGTDDQPAEDDV